VALWLCGSVANRNPQSAIRNPKILYLPLPQHSSLKCRHGINERTTHSLRLPELRPSIAQVAG